MGKHFYDLATSGGMGMGWTFEVIGELTLPQLRCLQHQGTPPAYPVRKFASMEEAEEYRKQFSAPGRSRSRS